MDTRWTLNHLISAYVSNQYIICAPVKNLTLVSLAKIPGATFEVEVANEIEQKSNVYCICAGNESGNSSK